MDIERNDSGETGDINEIERTLGVSIRQNLVGALVLRHVTT